MQKARHPGMRFPAECNLKDTIFFPLLEIPNILKACSFIIGFQIIIFLAKKKGFLHS